MSQHTKLGDVALVVGSYEKAPGEIKKRYRNVGTLMETVEDGGEVRHWLKLDADILQPSLFSLCARATMKKGDDQITAVVFAPREEQSSGGSKPKESFVEESAPPF